MTTQCSAHYNLWPWLSGDRACEGGVHVSDDSPQYGSFSPSVQIRGASRPNEGIQSGTGIAIVGNVQARDRLGNCMSTLSKNHKWPRGGTEIGYDNAVEWSSEWRKY